LETKKKADHGDKLNDDQKVKTSLRCLKISIYFLDKSIFPLEIGKRNKDFEKL